MENQSTVERVSNTKEEEILGKLRSALTDFQAAFFEIVNEATDINSQKLLTELEKLSATHFDSMLIQSESVPKLSVLCFNLIDSKLSDLEKDYNNQTQICEMLLHVLAFQYIAAFGHANDIYKRFAIELVDSVSRSNTSTSQ